MVKAVKSWFELIQPFLESQGILFSDGATFWCIEIHKLTTLHGPKPILPTTQRATDSQHAVDRGQ